MPIAKPKGNRVKVAIVIPNYNGVAVTYNGKNMLKQTLDLLEKTTYKNYKIIVVDDCSTDSSVEFLKKRKIETIVLKTNQYNLSKVANIGIRHAMRRYNPEYIVLSNSDVFTKDHNWLTEFIRVAQTEKSAGLIACKVINPDGTLQTLGSFLKDGKIIGIWPKTKKGFHGYIEPDLAPSCIFMVTRDAIEKVGLLDENFIMGWEDGDYSVRVRKAGYRLLTTEKTKVIHLASLTQRSVEKASLERQKRKTYHIIRNDLYFFDKHPDLFTSRQRLSRFAMTFMGVSFIRNPTKANTIFRIKKYRSLWNIPTALKALLDYKLGN
jgi:GT2 family glycosyltransferase